MLQGGGERIAWGRSNALVLRGGTAVGSQQAIASALGWTLSMTACVLYTPIISSLVRERRVPASLSSTTWALQLAGFGVFVVYHYRMGYPLSTYFDFVALCVQTLAVLALVAYYRDQYAIVVPPVAAILAAAVAPPVALQGMQLAATASSTWDTVNL